MSVSKQIFHYQNQVLIKKVTIQPPFREEKNFHNQGCFVYMKEVGGTVYSLNDTNLEIAPKEAVLLKCGRYFIDFVNNFNDQPVEAVAIHLYPSILRKIFINELPSLIEKQANNPKTKHIADQLIISNFIKSLDFYFDNPELVNDSILELKIKELILTLIKTRNIDSVLELTRDLYTPKMVTLKEVINQHLYSNLTIDDLAKLSQMSLSSFKRAFKKEFDDSPKNYINQKRIEKSKVLLQSTSLSISEIADQVGFQDADYFSKSFKKNQGLTPSAYKNGSVKKMS